MPITRRRTQRPRAAVWTMLAQLQMTQGSASPPTEKRFVRLLLATRHAAQQPQVPSTRGHQSRWSESDKSRGRLQLTDNLVRGTKCVGVRSFLEHQLLLLEFPVDVVEALDTGMVNLFESKQLARLSVKRFGLPEAKGWQRCQAFVKTHLQA